MRRIIRCYCYFDPAWTLDLLRAAAPTLQEMSVALAPSSKEHLRVVHALPKLTRLRVSVHGPKRALDTDLPPLHTLPQNRLRWLSASDLPRKTLVSLVRAHSATLEVLQLHVGTAGESGWPLACKDLDVLLRRECGLGNRRDVRYLRVVLRRPGLNHSKKGCSMQLTAVRTALCGATVLCSECTGLPEDRF